jgi:hypothetical protein
VCGGRSVVGKFSELLDQYRHDERLQEAIPGIQFALRRADTQM